MAVITRFLILLGCTLILDTAIGKAAEFPDRPVRIVVGGAPGSTSDIIPRLLAPQLQKFWGQPVIIDNKPGADGAIAAESVAHSKPDGYMLHLAPSAFTIVASQTKANYDPVKDFAPIILIGQQPFIFFVSSALKVNSLQALIDLAKSKPGQLNFASTGPVSPAALAIDLLMNRTNTKIVNVSYSGGSRMVESVLSGETQIAALPLAPVIEQIKAGKLRALAVAAPTRLSILPDVPTVEEAAGLKGFDIGSWIGIVAAAGTPPEVVARLHNGFVEALKAPVVREFLDKVNFVIIAGTPQQFAQFMAHDLSQWTTIIKDLNLK